LSTVAIAVFYVLMLVPLVALLISPRRVIRAVLRSSHYSPLSKPGPSVAVAADEVLKEDSLALNVAVVVFRTLAALMLVLLAIIPAVMWGIWPLMQHFL
jgi:hypothetical protein